MKASLLLALSAAVLLCNPSSRAASIGDAAPPLPIERWIKGAPVKVGPGANVFVVEFWATWCGPCRRTIPHLTQVQKKYADKGVIVIGVSDETVAKVQPFVTEFGTNMDYRVAVDSSQRSLRNWHTAFGATGIPHAFVVNTNGMVMWHGFPNQELERTLDNILAGTFDLERAKRKEAGDRLVLQYTAVVTRANATAKAAPLGDKILTEFSPDWRIPHHLAKAILTDPVVRSRDLPLALRATTLATEMTKGRSSDALALHGRALFANGKKQDGIATLKSALDLSTDPTDKAEFQKILTMLEKAMVMTGDAAK